MEAIKSGFLTKNVKTYLLAFRINIDQSSSLVIQEVGILKMKTTQDEPSQEPIRAFIINEFNFATKLATYIHKTLVDINKVVRSSMTPNEATVALITTIVNQKVNSHN